VVFYRNKLKVSLLVMATGAMALSAPAQPSGQDIIFSSPKTDDAQAVTPSLTPQNSLLPELPGTLRAPELAFPAPPSGERLPPPPVNSSDQQRLNQLQAERRNWTLMTPAEIFGVTPTEKLLQPPERDAFGREKKPTQLERYLARENSAQTGLTNGWRSDRANSPWSFSRAEDNASPFARRLDGTADAAQNLNRFLDSQQNPGRVANQNGTPIENGFDAFAQKKLTQEKLEQQASMERFRQMLAPSSEPSPNSQYFPVPKPAVDPYLTQPEFVPNPAGASFKPLVSDIGRPAGLTPLPGVVTPRLQPVVIPSWKPQPPPWLSPTPTAFPQQRF
jgi:hypothetical protein